MITLSVNMALCCWCAPISVSKNVYFFHHFLFVQLLNSFLYIISTQREYKKKIIFHLLFLLSFLSHTIGYERSVVVALFSFQCSNDFIVVAFCCLFQCLYFQTNHADMLFALFNFHLILEYRNLCLVS